MSYAAAVGTQRPRVVVQNVAQESLTATLTTSPDVKCLDLLKTLYTALRPADITCLQPLGRNQYAISFVSDVALERAQNLTTDKVQSLALVNGRTRVRCFNVPPYGEWEPLLNALKVYGTVEDHFLEMYRDYHNIATGCRIVLLKFHDPATTTAGPLPETLRIRGRVIRFDYAGLAKSCFSCRKTGHNAKDCPTKQAKSQDTTTPAAPIPPEVGDGGSTPSVSNEATIVAQPAAQPMELVTLAASTKTVNSLVTEEDIHSSFGPLEISMSSSHSSLNQSEIETVSRILMDNSPTTTLVPLALEQSTPTAETFTTPPEGLYSPPQSQSSTPMSQTTKRSTRSNSLERPSTQKRPRSTPHTKSSSRGLHGLPLNTFVPASFMPDSFQS